MIGSTVGKDPSALVVDDVTEMRFIFSHMLKTLGFVDIVQASSRQEAMRLLGAGHFDFVILDQRMADVDGRSVVRWMRTEWKSEKKPYVIMVTGHTDKKRAPLLPSSSQSMVFGETGIPRSTRSQDSRLFVEGGVIYRAATNPGAARYGQGARAAGGAANDGAIGSRRRKVTTAVSGRLSHGHHCPSRFAATRYWNA